MPGRLLLVPVPIGNPADITLRALDALRTADVVAAEDTRHFASLARHHGLAVRAVSVHEHNEAGRVPELVARLRDGATVALVSDAGTPLINDPGFRLVTAAIAAGFDVTSLPGASAVTTGLAGSGLPPVPFRFCGFAPRTAAARRRFYGELAPDQATLVVFEAPHRLRASLADAHAVLGERAACLARNLTKPHERYQRGTLSELARTLDEEAAVGEVRGESTLLIAGAAAPAREDVHLAEAAAAALLGDGVAPRVVTSFLTGILDVPRRRAYQLAHPRRGGV